MILKYSNNIWEEEDVDEKFDKILYEIQQNSDTKIILLYGNGLKERHIKKLAGSLIQHQNLKILDLSYNYVHGTAIPYLAQIIKQSASLQRIDLEYNNITDADLSLLIDSLREMPDNKLKKVEICLANNRITNGGLEQAYDRLSTSTIASMEFTCNTS